jgi:undecaprenyl-diphosphatase
MNITLFNFFFSFSSNPNIAWLSLFLSNIFIYILIVLAILIPIFLRRDFIYSILIFCTGAGAWVLAYIIKNIFMIPRPFVTLNLIPLFMETGFSFPSSHVVVISALSVLVWNKNRNLGIIFSVFALLIGFSRIVIGVHYPIDVIAGLCLGALIGLSALYFYGFLKKFAFLRKYI